MCHKSLWLMTASVYTCIIASGQKKRELLKAAKLSYLSIYILFYKICFISFTPNLSVDLLSSYLPKSLMLAVIISVLNVKALPLVILPGYYVSEAQV